MTAVGEAGHASMPNVGDNAVPLLGELLRRVGRGMPDPGSSPWLEATLSALGVADVGCRPRRCTRPWRSCCRR